MHKIYQTVDELIGNTPLVSLKKSLLPEDFNGEILLKVESFNPGGSIKDRIAREIIDQAEQEGAIQPGGTIVEASSGNTGIGLAVVGAARGYQVILTMPETMSKERRDLLRTYGAKLVLTPGDQGMKGAMAKAEEIAKETPNAFLAHQFENTANPQAHLKTTGPEIWQATDGKLDVFVAGIGTGGTITGVGQYLRQQQADLEIVAVEPTGSPVLSGGQPGPHKLQGIGAGFVPDVLDTSIYDRIATVTDEDALAAAQLLAQQAGLFVGISSGAAVSAALDLAKQADYRDQTIVVILPDSGDRYLSVDGFIPFED